MILYHGSNIEIEKIDLGKSKPFKDFGQGFYLSDNELQAKGMAQFRANIVGGEPVITKFEFNKEALLSSNLKVKIFENYSDEWVDFIIANREGYEIDKCDFVYGPIADDKVGLQLRKYKDEAIDKNQLLEKLKYMKGVTFHYYFGSEKAVKYLNRI